MWCHGMYIRYFIHVLCIGGIQSWVLASLLMPDVRSSPTDRGQAYAPGQSWKNLDHFCYSGLAQIQTWLWSWPFLHSSDVNHAYFATVHFLLEYCTLVPKAYFVLLSMWVWIEVPMEIGLASCKSEWIQIYRKHS